LIPPLGYAYHFLFAVVTVLKTSSEVAETVKRSFARGVTSFVFVSATVKLRDASNLTTLLQGVHNPKTSTSTDKMADSCDVNKNVE